jgi:hypothetical protein
MLLFGHSTSGEPSLKDNGAGAVIPTPSRFFSACTVDAD